MALQLIQSTPSAPAHVCWLCQQSAEKALKAALVSDNVHFPLTHDLDILLNLLPQGWTVHSIHNNLSDLTEWSIEARYPGDWPEPTNKDAVMAESKARSIYDSVASEFVRRGMLI